MNSSCKYCEKIPNLNLCMAYSKAKREDGLHWAHYPECTTNNCPLLNKNLLIDGNIRAILNN